MSSFLNIGAELVAARTALGLTQTELGARLGVAQPQIARWEAAAYRNVTLERVSAVADALGVQPSELPVAAEERATYGQSLPGAEPEALAVLDRTGTDPAAIAAFASSHSISRLDIFGSALRSDFTPQSDVDVLVTYRPEARVNLFDFEDHEKELAGLFRRRVDLVAREGIESSHNERRKRSILGSARVLYARP